MADSNWGLCRECQWWQIEPEANVADHTMGHCIEEQLREVRLRVSGNSGCSRFTPGKSARAENASAKPPTEEANQR